MTKGSTTLPQTNWVAMSRRIKKVTVPPYSIWIKPKQRGGMAAAMEPTVGKKVRMKAKKPHTRAKTI